MKLKHNVDPGALLQAVQACRHDVIFLSAEKDKLNLKSHLCGYVFLVLSKHPELLETGELLLDQEDEETMRPFLA